jgi:sarcosine oxidase, subunit gamma
MVDLTSATEQQGNEGSESTQQVVERSPLYAQALPLLPHTASDSGLILAERTLRAHINIRCEASKEIVRAVNRAIGIELPTLANTVNAVNARELLWLSPDEWLLIAPMSEARQLMAALDTALAAQHYALNDLSSAQTVFALRGPHARDVIAKGCSFDLYPQTFTPGQCAQTNVAKATGVLIARTDGVDIVVRRSFAEYLWRWLRVAAAEYKPTFTTLD